MIRIIIRQKTDPLSVAEYGKGQLQILPHCHPVVAVFAVFTHQRRAVQLGHPGRLNRPSKEGAVVDEHRKQLLPDGLPVIRFPGQPGCLHRFFPGAILVIVHQAADGHVRIVAFRRCQQFFKHVCIHPVVTVHKSHIIRRGGFRPSLPGGGKTAVFLMDHPDPGILFCPGITECPGIVRRTVVHQDDLHILQRLAADAVHTSFQIFFHVVHRYNHTHSAQ